MKKFKIYANPQESYQAVKQGWSWSAFFLGFLWAAYQKMWILAVCVYIGFVIFSIILGIFDSDTSYIINIVYIIVSIIFGIYGNKLIEKKLLKHGYEYKCSLDAAGPKDALNLFLKEISNQSLRTSQ
jgi:hypothetical protein